MIKREDYIIKKLVKKKVICDKCGKEMTREANAFMSNPPKFLFVCSCGNNEYVVCDDLSDEFKLEKIQDNNAQNNDLEKEIQTQINSLVESGTSAENLSDGYHTFKELYHHRAVLFALLCNQNQNIAWKSLLHSDPSDKMFDGMFIVGINTPEGQVTYHYDIDPYWKMFHVPELKRAPKWDGHTATDAVNRLQRWSDSIERKQSVIFDGRR